MTTRNIQKQQEASYKRHFLLYSRDKKKSNPQPRGKKNTKKKIRRNSALSKKEKKKSFHFHSPRQFSSQQRHVGEESRKARKRSPSGGGPQCDVSRMIKNPDNLPRGSGNAWWISRMAQRQRYTTQHLRYLIGKLGYSSDTQDRGMSAAMDDARLRFRRRLLV